MAFIETGFTNCKKAIEEFKDHEDSSCHSEAVNVSEIAERNENLPKMFDSKLPYEKFDNRQALLEILEFMMTLTKISYNWLCLKQEIIVSLGLG